MKHLSHLFIKGLILPVVIFLSLNTVNAATDNNPDLKVDSGDNLTLPKLGQSYSQEIFEDITKIMDKVNHTDEQIEVMVKPNLEDRQKLLAYRQQILELNKTLKELKLKIKELKLSTARLTFKNAFLKETNNNISAEIQRLKNETNILKNENNILKNENNVLKNITDAIYQLRSEVNHDNKTSWEKVKDWFCSVNSTRLITTLITGFISIATTLLIILMHSVVII